MSKFLSAVFALYLAVTAALVTHTLLTAYFGFALLQSFF
jgi:hypothetical protein